jgi:hypothetical protein
LLTAIEQKREQMIKIAKIHGLSSTQVLKCSQELDRMIHLYHSKTANRIKSPKRHFVLFQDDESWDVPPLKKAQ